MPHRYPLNLCGLGLLRRSKYSALPSLQSEDQWSKLVDFTDIVLVLHLA